MPDLRYNRDESSRNKHVERDKIFVIYLFILFYFIYLFIFNLFNVDN